MKYLIMSYGYDVKKPITVDTLEQAEKIMDQRVKDWCQEHDIDPYEEGYSDGDDYFKSGIDERGAAIYELFEVPEIKTEYEQLMWDLKMQLEKIEYAAIDYKYSLEECMVEEYAEDAKRMLDRMNRLLNP